MPSTHAWGCPVAKRRLIHLSLARTKAKPRERVPAVARTAGRYNTSSNVRQPSRSTTMFFQLLAKEWKRKVEFISSPREMSATDEYRQIVDMGRPVVPLILREMEQHPHFWFEALSEITKEDPIPPEIYGDVPAMCKAWLDWGREHGIQW